jgi:uncharacterized protein YecT (DUF1311 family)
MNWRYSSSRPPRLFAPSATLLVWLLIPVAQIYAQTQAEMNATAREDFARADADLNKTYQGVLKKLPDAESKQELKEAQRAWLASRDAEATHAADEARGGSMATTLRYETMTELTQQRTKQLETRLTSNATPDEKDASTPSPTPTATSSGSAQESDKEPAAPNPSSVSPDKKWEYNCGEYGLGYCYPEIVKAGTTERALDLDQELDVSGPDSRDAEVLWAPDSKRFAFNYSPLHAHHYVWITVAFYELRGEQWVALPSLLKESERSQVVQLAKEQLPKKLRGRREAARRDILKIRRWIDRDTAILYAFSVWDDAAKAAFLLTVKLDAGGKPKIVKTERLHEKEAEEQQ